MKVRTQFVDIECIFSYEEKRVGICQKNDVKVTEIKVGYDGIMANSKKGQN